MAKFIVSINTELRIEAETAEEALATASGCRKSMMACIQGRLEELKLEKVSMEAIREVTEVNAAWLENRNLRTKHRREWEYTSRQVPVHANSNVFFTHRIAGQPFNSDSVPSEGNKSNEPR